jgi:hypothetical protein
VTWDIDTEFFRSILERYDASESLLQTAIPMLTFPGEKWGMGSPRFTDAQGVKWKSILQFRLAQWLAVLALWHSNATFQARAQTPARTNAILIPANAAPSKLQLDVAAIDRERILKAANAALALEPVTITRFPARLSEGGLNDFYSNGDYWWPDPAKPDGLPYVQRDGESNPNNFAQHRLAVRDLRDAVAALGAAYAVTGEDRHAAQAVAFLRVFFLDPKTRMNPHLKYAQAIPGRSPGRGIGIIDALHLVEVPPAIQTMQKSPAFPPEAFAGLQQWFREFTDWMTTSKNGQEEANTKNNHAVAFYLQLAVYAQFIGDEAKLAQCRRQFKDVFVADQMAADGSFPRELSRTKPYGYSIFQLDNMATLCQVLSREDDNLWSFTLPDGRGMRQAMAFLYPYLADKSKWPRKPDIQAWAGWPARPPCLLLAGLSLGEPKYLDLWKKLTPDPTDAEVRRNIAITQPLLWVKAGKRDAAKAKTQPLPRGESASVPATASGLTRYLFALPQFKNDGGYDRDRLPPTDLTLTLTGMAKPMAVKLLGDGTLLKFESSGKTVTVQLPAARRSSLVDVVQVDLTPP